jgi:phosphate transport system substrate-binding protein
MTRRGVMAAALLAAPAILRASPPMIRIGGTGAALGGMKLLGDQLVANGHGLRVHLVTDLGTIGGIRALVAGILDLSVAARPITAAEAAQGLVDRSYASTPLALATHPSTEVTDLTLADAVAMIGGTRATWPDGTPVRVSRRPAKDTDMKILAGLSPAMAEAVAALTRRPGLATASSDHDQVTALEAARGSFGAIALSLVRTEQRAVTLLRLDGRAPDAADWPMHKPLHAVTRAAPSAAVQDFLAQLTNAQTAALLSPLGHSMPARA